MIRFCHHASHGGITPRIGKSHTTDFVHAVPRVAPFMHRRGVVLVLRGIRSRYGVSRIPPARNHLLKVGEKHSRWWATMTTANEQKRQTCGTVEWMQQEIRWRWSGTSSCPHCLTPDGPGASLPICDPSEKLHDGPNPDHLEVSRRSISCMNGTVLHSCPWRLNDLLSQKNALKTGTLVEPGSTRDKLVNHQPQPHCLCLSRWSA